MPIKPANRAKYPPNWAEIRGRVLLRANGRCEWCHAPDRQLVRRLDACPSIWREASSVTPALDAFYRPQIKIVLTTAHLDRELRNHAPNNLLALCQRCHLLWDRHIDPYEACRPKKPRGGGGTQPKRRR